MKRTLNTLIFLLFATISFSQSTAEPPTQGTLKDASENVSMDSTGIYQLFSTQNNYTFIKLNTRNGQMWQVQWGLEKYDHFETILSDVSLVKKDQESNGRFILYPTTNIYNFILLDQIDGRVWQVQWSKEKNERFVVPMLNYNHI